jgi:hypothetical protein
LVVFPEELSTFDLPLSTAFAQGTVFTCQGRLNIEANPTSGTNYLNVASPTVNLFFRPKYLPGCGNSSGSFGYNHLKWPADGQ